MQLSTGWLDSIAIFGTFNRRTLDSITHNHKSLNNFNHSRFLPNSTRYEQKMFRVLIQRMNGLRFGSFSKLVQLREYDYRSFDHLNLSDLFQFVSIFSCFGHSITASSTSIHSLHQKMSFDWLLFTHTHTFVQTAYSCGDLLRECWWRSRQTNCCELFAMSKSEYGYCYSFNSEAAPRTQYEKVHYWHTESNSFATMKSDFFVFCRTTPTCSGRCKRIDSG